MEQPEEECLPTGPQAPELALDPRPRRRATNHGAAVPDTVFAAKKVKETSSKGSEPDAVRRQSSRLVEAKTPPTKQLVAVGFDSSSQSGSSSSHSSSSSEPPVP